MAFESRLAGLYQLSLIDAKKEESLDVLVKLAASLFDASLVFITVVDKERLWFKAAYGTNCTEGPIKGSFCEITLKEKGYFQIENATLHPVFSTNPLVVNQPYIQFYAGYPLTVFDKTPVGTLCILDNKPKSLNDVQKEQFIAIANIANAILQSELEKKAVNSVFDTYLKSTSEAMCIVVPEKCTIVSFNQLFAATILKIHGVEMKVGDTIDQYFDGINLSNFINGVEKAMHGEVSTVERLVNFEKFSVWYYIQYLPINNSDGEIIAVAFTAKNVSNEHKYIDLLNETNQLANVGGWEMNLITNEVIWTTITKQILEVSEDYQPNANSIIEFIDRTDVRESLSELIQEAINKGKEFKLEMPIITQTGVSKWIVINAKTAFSDGKCIRLFGALRDISNDKEMHRSLIESREQYKGIIDNSSDIIYELDSNGYYQFVSKVWHQLLGHSIEEVMGKHFTYFIHQDDMETFQHYLNDLIGGKELEQMVEYRMRHNNGHFEWYESSCSTTKRNGELYVLGIGREITQIKADQNNLRALNEQLIQNAEKLTESEKNYSDLFLLSPQPMFIYDLVSYRFIKVNQAALVQYEYNEDEFLQLNLFDINHKDQQQGLEGFLKQKSTVVEKYALRSKHIKKSGEVIDVDVYSSMLVQQTNTYRIVLVIDVTKQLRRIQEIEKQNGLLKDIAWIQSHVVRAPLSNIMGLINILNSPMNKKENEADLFFKMLEEAKKLDAIIREIAQKANEAEVIEW